MLLLLTYPKYLCIFWRKGSHCLGWPSTHYMLEADSGILIAPTSDSRVLDLEL